VGKECGWNLGNSWLGYGQDFGTRSRLGHDGDATEGQGMAADMTVWDSDSDVARVGTWHDKDRDAEAWQDQDEDREAGNQR
jgi:hypothetical protein